MKSYKLILIFAVVSCGGFGWMQMPTVHAESVSSLRVVDVNGIVSYVSPIDGKSYVFFGATDAWIQLRRIGTAISQEDIAKIPTSESNIPGDMNLRKIYAGQFLFSLTDPVPLWFVSPRDLKRYYFDGTEPSYQFLIRMNTQPSQTTTPSPVISPPVTPAKVVVPKADPPRAENPKQLDPRIHEDNKKVQPNVVTPIAKKNIVINLAKQELHQREGDQIIATYKVSTGKASTPTPRGTFTISWKHPRAWSRSARLWMPYYMKFNNAGAGIHELPEWPNGKKEGEKDLGRRVSHGCVRLGVGAAKILFDWAPVGTPITIVAR